MSKDIGPFSLFSHLHPWLSSYVSLILTYRVLSDDGCYHHIFVTTINGSEFWANIHQLHGKKEDDGSGDYVWNFDSLITKLLVSNNVYDQMIKVAIK